MVSQDPRNQAEEITMDNYDEILINSQVVTPNDTGDTFEFVLTAKLKNAEDMLSPELEVVECVKVDSVANGVITPVPDKSELDGMLFELNHVRVNPRVDNSFIIECLTQALSNIGVNVSNPPDLDSMALCFKPLGEISDNVRFYVSKKGLQDKVIFLSPSTRPKLVPISNNQGLPPNVA